MNSLRCLGYRALEKFRRTAFATRFFYHGVPVRTLRADCSVEGTVQRLGENETDGDVTFNILLDDGTTRHVEVTPCAPEAIRRVARNLHIGARVKVCGEERYDPAHVFDGGHLAEGWLEIHPCQGIEVVL